MEVTVESTIWCGGLFCCGCAFMFGFGFLPNSLYFFSYLNEMTRSSPALFENKNGNTKRMSKTTQLQESKACLLLFLD